MQIFNDNADIKFAKRLLDTLQHFKCTDVHTRNNHIAKVSSAIAGAERNGVHPPFIAIVLEASRWVVDTMTEQLVAGQGGG